MIAINNSLTNLLGYPATNGDEEWPKFISMTPGEVGAEKFSTSEGQAFAHFHRVSYFDDLT